MSDTQYDVSEKVLKLYQIKQKQRNEAKAYFAKFMENPHRPVGEGPPFDSGLFRFSAMHVYSFEHFKPTPPSIFRFIGVTILPIAIIAYTLSKHLSNKEKILRSGVVAYKDRAYKSVL